MLLCAISDSGGEITVYVTKSLQYYKESVQNGIVSHSLQGWPNRFSFMFEDKHAGYLMLSEEFVCLNGFTLVIKEWHLYRNCNTYGDDKSSSRLMQNSA